MFHSSGLGIVRVMEGKTVLVTGGGGFLGSVLVPFLIERGYRVKVLDRFFFGKETLASVASNLNCTLIEDDIRWFPKELLRGVDAVIDCAALSNDPAADLDPELTMAINAEGRIRTARMARDMGVQRYILASSCSVYGFQDGVLDETAALRPLTTYARAAETAESRVLALSRADFFVSVLRQGTLYGMSPRMRFDLAVNAMVRSVFREGVIHIWGGLQWRPFAHVSDSARAFIAVLEADPTLVGGEVFNVGATGQNFQIGNLAKLVAEAVGVPTVINVRENAVDERSYRVTGDKIFRHLGFLPLVTPAEGAAEVFTALRNGIVADSLKTSTVEWYRLLLDKRPDILSSFVSSDVFFSFVGAHAL